MTDYISREAAIRAMCEHCSEKNICGGNCDETDKIQSIPAADVRSVVTCGECENWQTEWKPNAAEGCHFCAMTGIFKDANWFCADGERRKTENE